jgi:hypothetical protein
MIILVASCNENEFLETKPKAFYAPENSFVTYNHFEMAVWDLYSTARYFYEEHGQNSAPRVFQSGTDVAHWAELTNPTDLSKWLVPTNNFTYDAVWRPCYLLIYEANSIIERSEGAQSELTDDEKTLIQAEARFFRGWAHMMLAHLYAGVPIVLEETKTPKRDYVRASRSEVYEQSVSDLKFAAENLKGISQVEDSRISNLVAYHVLTEAYISLGQWDDAISAATTVIDDPNTALMMARFGRRMNDALIPEMPWAQGGDVYWDLFRQGNQNRSAGNTEALWVLQFAFNVPGGGGYDPFLGGPGYERIYNARLWMANVFNKDNKPVPIIPQANTYYGGRSAGMDRLSSYFFYDIWQKSGWDQDIRNSEYNLIRDLKVNNPKSDYNGKWIIADNVPIQLSRDVDTLKNWHPALVAKISSMGDHPKDIWEADQTIPGTITMAGGPSNVTHRDVYQYRLAETYLLRAEAWLGKGDQIKAAEDINAVRGRAQAPNVSPEEVDIDYILDERMRELYLEEARLLTLTRLGKLVERTRKYNPKVGSTYEDHNNLWPIPFSEIEKNIEAQLEQNPGYPQN